MSKSQTHFEIHGQRAGAWTVQKVCDDKETAVDFAKTLKSSKSLEGVKVLQVTFDAKDPVFHDKEIYFDGDRSGGVKQNAVDLIEPICQSVEDVYKPDARRAVFQLLRKPMEGWQITPLELLYHHGYLQRLNDTGQILQGAVQRVAISQVQKTGQKVNDRVLELYSITNDALHRLKEISIDDQVPDIENDSLIKLSKASKEMPDWRRAFMMALARHFQSTKTLDEKFEKILDWLNQYDDPDVLEMLDRYLGDFLSSPVYLQKLLGEKQNLGDAMLELIDFIRGAKEIEPDTHRSAIRMNALLRDQFLPEVRKALTVRLLETLKGNKSFVANDPYKSVLYHDRILSRLQISEGEHIGGEEIVEILQERCERMTGSTTVAQMLSDVEHPLDKVEKLLKVSKGVIGAANKRTIANYLLPVLESAQNFKLILETKNPPLATIAWLRKLQEMTLMAGFQQYYCDKISERLDSIAVDLLSQLGVLEAFSRQAKDNTQLGLNLLQILASEKLTQPIGLSTVRDYAKKMIVSEEFMKTLEIKAKEGTSQVEFFKLFYQALEKAGIR